MHSGRIVDVTELQETIDRLKNAWSKLDLDGQIEAGFTIFGAVLMVSSSCMMFGYPALLFWFGYFLWKY